MSNKMYMSGIYSQTLENGVVYKNYSWFEIFHFVTWFGDNVHMW